MLCIAVGLYAIFGVVRAGDLSRPDKAFFIAALAVIPPVGLAAWGVLRAGIWERALLVLGAGLIVAAAFVLGAGVSVP